MSHEPKKSELIDQTIELWQVYSNELLTTEDAREIVENVAGVFTLLLQWDAACEALQSRDPEDDHDCSDRSELK